MPERANAPTNRLIAMPQRWAQRRLPSEREFLPAALEIIETPVSPAGRIMMAVVGLIIVIGIVWASISQIDIVTSASGRVIPSGQIKLIQPLQLGVVKRIAVTDGDRVRANDVLVELDPTTNAADRDRYARDLVQSELDVARLRAFLAGSAGSFQPPPDVDSVTADMERRQLIQQLAEEKAKIAGLNRQVAEKAAEREQAAAAIAKIDASLPLLKQKLGIYNKLRALQFSSEVTRLETERQVLEAGHDREAAVQQVAGAAASIGALAEQSRETEAQFRRQALDDMRKAEQSASEQRQELVKATKLTGLQVLRAPVDGTVEQLAIHTNGGVVQPAQTLMVIVPNGSKLEVEAILANRDAGFVHAGQPAELKVEAFSYTRYGLLHGRVSSVSRDALRSERDAPDPDRDANAQKSASQSGGNAPSGETAYVARVSVEGTAIQTEQGLMPVEPGMTVTAEIKTGQRRIISYLLSPFMRYRHEALRER
jgi:hemolysin D